MAKESDGGRSREAALDAVYRSNGGELGWDSFGSGLLDPSEILERAESGEVSEFALKVAVMQAMLNVVLDGWGRSRDVLGVGVRCLRLARTVGHARGEGLRLLGVRKELGGNPGAEVCRRILDQWLWDGPDAGELGKRCLAIGRFFNHAELDGVSLTKLAKICGESATWMMKRVRKEVNRPIEFGGGSGKATWQHGKEQRARSARVRRESFLNNQ